MAFLSQYPQVPSNDYPPQIGYFFKFLNYRHPTLDYGLFNFIFAENLIRRTTTMYWTLELASYLEDAPWPATKDELIDFSIRSGAPLEVVENLQELEDDGQPYESIEEIWPDYPTKEDFFFNEDEY
jgi:hypothetical protein